MPRPAKVVTPETLAGAFVALLARDLSPVQLAKVGVINAHNEGDACASHDYTDANMVMSEAFEALVGREPFGEQEEDGDILLWNAAWTVAKKDHLSNPVTIEQLTVEFGDWCKSQDLPHIDADDLIVGDISHEQRQWLSRFIALWEAVEAIGVEVAA